LEVDPCLIVKARIPEPLVSMSSFSVFRPFVTYIKLCRQQFLCLSRVQIERAIEKGNVVLVKTSEKCYLHV
jgi:hypothetical protein